MPVSKKYHEKTEMKKSILQRTLEIFFLASISANVFAGDTSGFLRWTNAVGEVIKPTNVTMNPPLNGLRFYPVRFTYEALKPCKELSAYGRNYSKDGTEIGTFALGLGGKLNVAAGQKFRDEVVINYEQGHYLVLDKVYCR